MKRAGAPFWKTPLFPFTFAGLTGERGRIPEPVMESMRKSGLAHLLAISGLHMGLVAATLFFVLRLAMAAIEPVALRCPIKKWAASAALAGALFYLLISGATVPTQRAFVIVCGSIPPADRSMVVRIGNKNTSLDNVLPAAAVGFTVLNPIFPRTVCHAPGQYRIEPEDLKGRLLPGVP